MNLKATKSSTGLSEKYIVKLIKAYHCAPTNFTEAVLEIQNLAGITILQFGITTRLPVFLLD